MLNSVYEPSARYSVASAPASLFGAGGVDALLKRQHSQHLRGSARKTSSRITSYKTGLSSDKGISPPVARLMPSATPSDMDDVLSVASFDTVACEHPMRRASSCCVPQISIALKISVLSISESVQPKLYAGNNETLLTETDTGLNVQLMNTTIADRLREARRDNKFTQRDLEKVSGVSQQTISKLERGIAKKSGVIVQIAKALDVNPGWLATGDGSKHDISMTGQSDRSVPLLQWSNLGDVPHLANWTQYADRLGVQPDGEKINATVEVSRDAFGLIVHGDSMEPEFSSGTKVIVEPRRKAKPGDFVVAKAEGAYVLRHYQLDGSMAVLRPLNNSYPIQRWNPESIVGVVVEQNKQYI